jgi:cell division protease FtsH
VNEAHSRAREILTSNRAVLNDMSSALIEYETIDGERLRELLNRVAQLQLPEPHTNGNGTEPVVGATTPLQA